MSYQNEDEETLLQEKENVINSQPIKKSNYGIISAGQWREPISVMAAVYVVWGYSRTEPSSVDLKIRLFVCGMQTLENAFELQRDILM
jgi:hypothetical protein